jgi:phospholipid/cholesterol/gamma-HCH transport system ATP-binding protein
VSGRASGSGIAQRDRDREATVDGLLAIATRGLRKRFGAHDVLAGVDLDVPEGLISVLLGPSGTGKSVLLKHVLGLLKPDDGDILVRGRALSDMSHSEMIGLRRQIGVMFQDGALFSSMTVYDNVAFPLRQHTDLRERQLRELVKEQLEAVGLTRAALQFPSQLSGGMRKRAGLARALVLEPGIILCDEPDSGLDPVRTSLLGDLLMERHAAVGGTMLIVTHDIALAKSVSDHVSVIREGKIVASGAAERVFDSDEPFVRQFLAGATDGPLSMG